MKDEVDGCYVEYRFKIESISFENDGQIHD